MRCKVIDNRKERQQRIKDWNFKDLYVVGDKLYKKWGDNYSDECIITDLTDVRGIIHSEAH